MTDLIIKNDPLEPKPIGKIEEVAPPPKPPEDRPTKPLPMTFIPTPDPTPITR
jgi:hypothetical protein